MRTIIKIQHDRMKTQTEESHIYGTIETVTFNMSMIKRTNPKFYEGIVKIYNQVPFFLVDKKEEPKEQKEEVKDVEKNKEELKSENVTDPKADRPS